jgi:hypothetical protein
MPRRLVYGLDEKYFDAIKRDDDLKHHIPNILLEKINNLKTISYKDRLQEFKNQYENVKFTNIKEEYTAIENTLCNILNESFSHSFNKLIQSIKELNLLEPNLHEGLRERFVHPFQNFLLGSIIIDHYYDRFSTWYSTNLCSSINTNIEISWLLASIFHDRFKPIQNVRLDLNEKLLYHADEVSFEIYQPENYISPLISLYYHLNGGNDLHTWKKGKIKKRNDLYKIIYEQYMAQNHGVVGSIQTLRNMFMELKYKAFNPCIVNAALAIALHDHAIHQMFFDYKIMPIKQTDFPIQSLLLYCDAIQEWGRYLDADLNTSLVNIIFKKNSLNLEIAFISNDAAKIKIEEIRQMKKCIIFDDDLQFYFTTRSQEMV